MTEKTEINVSFKLTGKGIEAFNRVKERMSELLPGADFAFADVGRQSVFMAADSIPSTFDMAALQHEEDEAANG